MEESKPPVEDEHIIVPKDKYVLKKLVAFDLIIANNRIKTISISGVLLSILVYGTFVFNQTVSMISTMAAIVIFGINMVVSERKIKYYETKYTITRPPGILAMLKGMNARMQQSPEDKT